jgi:hypothetical protein
MLAEIATSPQCSSIIQSQCSVVSPHLHAWECVMFKNTSQEREELLNLLLSNHNDKLYREPEGGDGSHVAEIWEDGEFTLTKGGSLLGQRSLHCISPGHPLLAKQPLDLPTKKNYAGHNSVAVPFDVAQQVEAMLWR